MYTTDDHKEKIYEEIRDLMKLCDSYENEVTAISNGTMYLVEDYCTAGSIDVEERLQNKLYINNIQIMASRIRIMADKINSTLIQPITNMTYDPSEETQIFLEEVLLRINELTHSIKTSYNNIRLLYQYMTGKAPEAHTVECVIIPYLNFSSITEKDDENNDDVESEYPNAVSEPANVRKMFEERLKAKVKEQDNSFDGIEEIDTIPEGTSFNDIIDKDTWIIAGFITSSDGKYLPMKTKNSKEAWLVWPDFNKIDFPDEFDPNKYYFVHYDQDKATWVRAYRGNHSFSTSEIYTYITGTIESGCIGKVDSTENLPAIGKDHDIIYVIDENKYYQFIQPIESWGVSWMPMMDKE